MKFLLLTLLTLPVYGALSPLIVKESALKHHPTVLAAMERMRAGEETMTGAKGAFDAKAVSDYRRQMKGDYKTTVARSFLVKPLGIANSKIYAGAEEISNAEGRLSPVFNTGNPSTTGQAGIYSVLGVQLSLWKNLTLDPARAALKNAKYDAAIAKSHKRLTELNIGRLGQLAYWEWVTAQKVKTAFEQLLKNGETRNEYLNARTKRGDIAQIIVTENEQYVASRKGSLQAAKERVLRAEYALSMFNRNENGEPIIPQEAEAFEDYPADLSTLFKDLDLSSNVDELIKKRPDMKNLSLYVDRTGVDLELARQDLRPQVDVSTEYYKRSANGVNMPDDYLMVLAQVSIPIERNLGNGNIAAARARQMIAQREMNHGLQLYKYEVMASRQALQLQLEQVTQSEIELSKSKELVSSENYKFQKGGGNLFLVNLREEAQARAEASFHESRLQFMNTLLSYQALVSTEKD
jgi:outer membrane protein TolC